AILCAATMMAVVPVLGVAALPTALATIVGGIGANVSASLLQNAFQRSVDAPTPEEEQHLIDLAQTLEPTIASNAAIRRELGAFLETYDAVEIANAVLEGNPTHGWLLMRILQEII